MSMETPENIATSSAKEFKLKREAREKGELLTLSSGLVVLVKRPNITRMIAKGLVPNSILQKFMVLQDKNTYDPKDIEAILVFQKEMAKQALVKPIIVDEPNYDNDEISVDDLEDTDLAEIWQYVNGGIEEVDKFRRERQSGLSVGQDSNPIPE